MISDAVWTCESCLKTFTRKGDLTRHMHLHTGYKPHACPDCGKTFAQFTGLKTHRNIHTKVKPFACGLDGCTVAFGDPSSCNRHRKERHQIIGAYRCPVPHCRSSIKRRSVFKNHLRKHRIDPDTVDMKALAPTLLPRQALQQRKSRLSLPIKSKPLDATPNVPYTNDISYDFNVAYSKAPSYDLPYTSSYATANGWSSAYRSAMQSLASQNEGLYTLSPVPSPPDLDFSMSPSPTPSQHDVLRTPEANIRTYAIISRPPSADHMAPHSLCSSPHTTNTSFDPLSRFSPSFFFQPTPTRHNEKQPTWDMDSLLFGTSHLPLDLASV